MFTYDFDMPVRDQARSSMALQQRNYQNMRSTPNLVIRPSKGVANEALV